MEPKKFLEKIKQGFERKGILLSETQGIVITLFFIGLFLVFLIGLIFTLLPKTRVEIRISGPEEVRTGETATYIVECKNTGNVILENPELFFIYPNHSLPEKKELMEIVGTDKFLGAIYPKEVKTFQFKAQLFGPIGERQEFKSWLTFKTKGNLSLQRSPIVTFSTRISSEPVELEFDISPKIPISPKTRTGFKFELRYISNVDYPLSNLKIKIIYPQNFIVKDSRPEKGEGEFWEISSLTENQKGEIEVWGEFSEKQEIGKEIPFKAQLFITIRGEDVLLKEIEKTSLTYKPILLISQKINGKLDYAASIGERLHYQIFFKNVHEEPLRDLILISILEGNLYDFSTIEAPEGEFRPGDNSIVWTGEKTPLLRYNRPGEEGVIDFWIKLKSDYIPKDFSETNIIIKNKILVGGFTQEFRNRVISKVDFLQEGYFKDKYGFFENSGPHPPRVDANTDYSIVWKIKNYYNPLKDLKVKAVLPSWVRVKSIQTPSRGEIKVVGGSLQEEYFYEGIPAGFKFEHDLYYGMSSDEVKYLQIILKKETPEVYPSTIPATGYFGLTTLKALINFQEKYRAEILTPRGLKTGIGFVDELTRLKLNELITKYIPAPNEIVWEIKELEPGVGIFSDPAIAAFQITLTPTLAQKGKIVLLIGEATLSATDQWAAEKILVRDDPIDTSLPDDPTAGKGVIR
jgi:hypothetical protein